MRLRPFFIRLHPPLLLFLFALLVPSLGDSDPLENLVSNFMLTVRGMGEKWLSSVAIPRLEDVNANPAIAYSIDQKTADALTSLGNFLNVCPTYLPFDEVQGTWHVLYVSRRFLETKLNDVNQVIDKLSSAKPLQPRSTLDSLFRGSLDIDCAQLTVLNGESARFEWSYSSRGSPRSIIGTIFKRADRSFFLTFAPTTELHLATSWSSPDSLILTHVDSWPPCDNYILLGRTRTVNTTILREKLTLQGGNLPSNPLVPVPCQVTAPPGGGSIKGTGPIISPVSSGPSQPQPWFEKNSENPWSAQSVSLPPPSLPLDDTASNSIQASSQSIVPPSIIRPVPLQPARIAVQSPPYPSQSLQYPPQTLQYPPLSLQYPSQSMQSVDGNQNRIQPAQLTFNQMGKGYVEVVNPLYYYN